MRTLRIDVGDLDVTKQVLARDVARCADPLPLTNRELCPRLMVSTPFEGLVECECRFCAVCALIETRAQGILEQEVDQGGETAVSLANTCLGRCASGFRGPQDGCLAQQASKRIIKADLRFLRRRLSVRCLPRSEACDACSPHKRCMVIY